MDAFADNENAAPQESLGQFLAAERERQGLSRADVAQRLHWSPLQVEAMETGDYHRLPKGTFLRGFVRNYARLLGVDPEAALAHLDQHAPKGPAPGIVVPTQNIRFDPVGTPTSPVLKAGGLALVALVLALAAIYWWIFIRPAPLAVEVAPTSTPGMSQPSPSNLAQPPVVAPDAVEHREAPKEAVEESRAAEMPQQPAVPAKAQDTRGTAAEKQPGVANLAVPVAANAAPAAGGKTLRFAFKAESWVEVRDGGGKVLLQQLHPPGATAEVSGRPPLKVIIGNAPDVSLTVDGREFALAPHTNVAVARFTLE